MAMLDQPPPQAWTLEATAALVAVSVALVAMAATPVGRDIASADWGQVRINKNAEGGPLKAGAAV